MPSTFATFASIETAAVPVVLSQHARQRMTEREINQLDIQHTVKYGRKKNAEASNSPTLAARRSH